MRNFAYINPDYIKNEVVPELIEDHPCYQQSVYDTVMYDESPDGDLIQCDMTQILLNQEKYRRLLGDMYIIFTFLAIFSRECINTCSCSCTTLAVNIEMVATLGVSPRKPVPGGAQVHHPQRIE